MKLSWNSLKISIAGAKLSHMVQKDKIWDPGSMTEQVKNIFYQLEKAKNKKETTAIKKYVTMKAYDTIDKLIKENGNGENVFKNTVLTEISIIEVNAGTIKNPDGFIALIKGKRGQEETPAQPGKGGNGSGVENFSEQWFFIRQGDWWLLDHIKQRTSLF